jgi:MEMO1 family protein
MSTQPVRHPAVAGSWYPGTAAALAREVDRYLSAVPVSVAHGTIQALVAPHAGLVYSGPVAAWAYRAVQGRDYEVVVLVGPSHQVGFEGVAIYPRGIFDTPLGPAAVEEQLAAAIVGAGTVVREYAPAHLREHSLEMQLPFLKRVLPDVPIVPLVMGYQTPATVRALGIALAEALKGRRSLLVASSDLSHYLDARTASAVDQVVLDLVNAFRPDDLLDALEKEPQHACGGGPIVSVMQAARALGAREGRVLKYADSGDVSGDKSAVVGYMAAAFGDFAAA